MEQNHCELLTSILMDKIAALDYENKKLIEQKVELEEKVGKPFVFKTQEEELTDPQKVQERLIKYERRIVELVNIANKETARANKAEAANQFTIDNKHTCDHQYIQEYILELENHLKEQHTMLNSKQNLIDKLEKKINDLQQKPEEE